MLESRFKRSLTVFEGRKGAFTYWLILFVPLFLLIMGFLNLYAASTWGKAADITLLDLLRSWGDIDPSKSYSGIYLKAQERINTAMLLFGISIVSGVFAYTVRFKRKMNKRITDILKIHEEW